MNSLKQFFLTLFVICILSAICHILSELSPGKSSSALKLICGLSLLATFASAIFSGSKNINTDFAVTSTDNTHYTDNYTSEYYESLLIDKTEEQLEKEISSVIFEKYGIKADDVSIDFSTEKKDGKTEVSIRNASISFYENQEQSSIAESLIYLEEMFGTSFAKK